MKTENNNPLSAIPFRHWLIALSLAFLAACTSDSGNSWNAEDVCPESLRGNFQDKRDGKWYSYTTIGDQVWMAENLDYTTENSECSEYIENYCDIYGRLYSFPDRSGMETICPEGWHLPTLAEWEELIETMGGKKSINKGVLKTHEGWFNYVKDKFIPDTIGTDLCGFKAIPGGGGVLYLDHLFNKTNAKWWTTTANHVELIQIYYMGWRNNDFRSGYDYHTIRCVKDK